MGNIKLSKGDYPADSMAESKRVYKQMNMIILNLR